MTARLLLAVAALGAAQAQFTDLQPGRNFPDVVDLTSSERTESVDFGDVDLDGDLDVVLGIGGDLGTAPNRIFVNQGGLQGGTEGVFVEETATRFAGFPDESTRDLDFGDIDADGDLDIVEANRGGNTTGSVMRFYVNQGGAQGGTPGFFAEGTDAAWGTLLTVPASDQVLGGDVGPWRNWSCDCDFADLDDDGDLDLFASSYGPALIGNNPSRVFLNDGSGVFHEQAPWAPANADIAWTTLDVELLDLDGDFDLDLFASDLDKQSRVFVSNLRAPLAGATTPYTDTTQASIVAPGAGTGGSNTYEAEFNDLDGDGDFELWMANYIGFDERILDTTSAVPGEVPLFVSLDDTFGNPNFDELEFDLFDFDGDGDLDAMGAASGPNRLFVNGLAQGVPGFHRAGTTAGGGQYPFDETPETGNRGASTDVEAADLDGDGDDDLVIVSEGAFDRLWLNELGIPDTHAPTFVNVTSPLDVPTSGTAVFHAAVRDNHAVYVVACHDVDLVVSIDGGPEQRVDMVHSGSMIFRTELDVGAGYATLEYRVEAVDGAGNIGVSSAFMVGSSWSDLGGGLAGVDGVPSLTGTGTLASGAPGALAVAQAAPSATALLVLSQPTPGVPFKGGTLLAVPFDLAIPLTTSPAGTVALPYVVPAGAPSGFAFHLQLLIADSAAIQGVALSNGLRGDVP